MGHSAGDTQLVMSLILMVVGLVLFLAGLGSGEWVEDGRSNGTVVMFGLWETCPDGSDEDCSAILPGSAKAYFEATRTVECLAVVVYGVSLVTCFLADDRDPGLSCSICLRRYIHAMAAFTAGGLTFLAILIFAACYKDDDWFTEPTLGVSYWLSLAGSLVTLAGGVMRVVFITWPDRPTLPTVTSRKKQAPQAPGRRTRKARSDNMLGADPLPVPLRPGEAGAPRDDTAAAAKRPARNAPPRSDASWASFDVGRREELWRTSARCVTP
ncbi:uncharacterized protein LOC143294432 [Babylonia areolata]|uniref:uncharacterized protein LOC143294432 n=1 Tax=Babylonia areolata TaxID=304850 RepID=UPI003FD56722